MKLIDADVLTYRLSTLDRMCRTDKMNALLGRVLFIVNKMPTAIQGENVKPIDKGDDSYACDKCGEIVGWEELDCAGIDPVRFKFCPGCGRKVKWDGKTD